MKEVSKYLIEKGCDCDCSGSFYYIDDAFIIVNDRDDVNDTITKFDDGWRICLENREDCDYDMSWILQSCIDDSCWIFENEYDCYRFYTELTANMYNDCEVE